MEISSGFDAGNAEVIDAQDPANVRLRIRPDAGLDHYQWFFFRVTGARRQPLVMHLENAKDASYPKGWTSYRACWSIDRVRWQRTDTTYDGERLTIRLTPPSDSVWLAYFAPYPHERHLDLIARVVAQGAAYERLGATVDGRDLDLLRVGPASVGAGVESPTPKLWVIARQHPGESMAEWLVEGLLDRLMDAADPVAYGLRSQFTLYVVPNMNPDGAFRGHLRNNAAGRNLNREWQAPSVETSPEVYWVRRKMESTGVDFFLDVHGDEALPYNFIAGAEGTPSWTEEKKARQVRFCDALLTSSPDFQTRYGYPVSRPGEANLAMATNWVGERFGCLAMTLEQPFKDTADTPREDEGWSPERAKRLGRAVLSAMWARREDFRGVAASAAAGR